MKSCSLCISIIVISLLLVFAACSRDEGSTETSFATPPVLPVKTLLVEPLSLQRTELPGEALPRWREARANKPALVLLAADPMLLPVPETLRGAVARLLASGEDSAVVSGSDPLRNSNPLLLPNMTVDAALRAGWFSEVLWVVPHADEQSMLSGELLLQQMQGQGLLEPGDAGALQLGVNALLSGTVRNVPFRAVTIETLPVISGPLVLHIDQDWFQQSYRTEIETPMLGLLFDTLGRLRAPQLQAVATTFCNGNLDQRISLDVRFAGDLLQQVLARPALLEEAPPENWRRMKDVLYLRNFMKKEMVRELSIQMIKEQPDVAWVHYVAYRAAADLREIQIALEQLAEAVRLDPIYALEYRDLMWKAYETGDLAGAKRMLDFALDGLPGNLEIQLQMARLGNDMSAHDVAKTIVKDLLQKNWSQLYYPETAEYLQGFLVHLERTASDAVVPKVNSTPSHETLRKRLLHPTKERK